MKALLVLLLVVLFSSSCKHKNELSTTPNTPAITTQTVTPVTVVHELTDFTFIPLNNAKWIVRFRGNWTSASTASYFDTNFYATTTVLATGDIMAKNAKNYLVYKTKTIVSSLDSVTAQYDGSLYVREDTASKELFYWAQFGNVIYPGEYPLGNYNLKMSDPVPYVFSWPNGTISSIDSIIIAGQYCKRWMEKDLKNNTMFYQAYGIGWQRGILPTNSIYTGNGGEVVSLDFVYKKDSIHFDYKFYDQ